ncbi:MAG TPA: pyridoxamine 5'-phosphate oxidase family protein [Euryarchaeota archaeon]|nr:pyridoxamine 5'-phosphate oxidase family protein [Euryarchaeota archaeon]
MAKLTQDILDQMKNQKVYALATASKDGVPNVVPVGMLIPKEDGTIWIIDNYFGKTIANMEENPKAAFYVWNPECKESWQVKGTLSIEDSGADYEAAVAFAHSIKEIFPAKHLVKMTVDEVYYVTPGDHAGKKIE